MGRSLLLKGAVVAVVLLAFAGAHFLDLISYVSPKRIEESLAAAGHLAPLWLMLSMAAAVVVAVIPSIPFDVAAGSFFGPIRGTVYSALGGLLGAVLSFLIARLLGRELIERHLKGHINFCTVCSDGILTRLVFVSRLLPIVSFDLVSYGAGLTKMSLFRFSLATFFGMLPLTFVYNYFGAILVQNPLLTASLAVVLVALFFALPRWIERYDPFSLRRFFPHLREGSENRTL